MASVNRVILIGNLGKAPELKYTTSNHHPVCNLSVATSERRKDKEEQTEWHNVVTFGVTAENCAKYLEKGRPVYIEGRIQTRSWEKDGQKKYMTEVIADRVVFLGSGQRSGQANTAPAVADEELPF